VTRYPLPAQRAEAAAKRRIGLGITGLADALIMCGRHYGSGAGRALVADWLETFRAAAYLASAELARERGPFPLFERERHLAAVAHRRLPAEVTAAIRRDGLRNGALTTVAPTGTTALYAGNVSSGIEPVFSLTSVRRMAGEAGDGGDLRLQDYAHARYEELGGDTAHLPEAFVTADALSPAQHLAMQATVQRYVDAAIAKTINCPADLPFAAFEDVYLEAYRSGCKGCTTYRPDPLRGQVLLATTAGSEG
jgi:ribonucleoside-diphosphate reductase alpha chain